MKRFTFIATLFAALFTFEIFAQEAVKPRPSPTAIVTMKYEDAYVKITYCQPHKKGREIFGELVPFGKVWRTGANEATEVTITQDITIAGKNLAAGTYAIFTIPNKDEWTIIFNTGLGQWGSYNYNEEQDVLRVQGEVSTTDKEWEPFTIAFEQKNSSANLVMMWDKTKVTLPLEFKSTYTR